MCIVCEYSGPCILFKNNHDGWGYVLIIHFTFDVLNFSFFCHWGSNHFIYFLISCLLKCFQDKCLSREKYSERWMLPVVLHFSVSLSFHWLRQLKRNRVIDKRYIFYSHTSQNALSLIWWRGISSWGFRVVKVWHNTIKTYEYYF